MTEAEDDGLKEEDERHSLVGSAAHEREVDATAVLFRLLLAHLADALCQSLCRPKGREKTRRGKKGEKGRGGGRTEGAKKRRCSLILLEGEN